MQVPASVFHGQRHVGRPGRAYPLARAWAWLMLFIAADRDRWVSVVCGTGFALLMWMDWLAA